MALALDNQQRLNKTKKKHNYFQIISIRSEYLKPYNYI